ncbi:hypothetical protein FRC08_015332 [Ceratobasidium sp. 394]|nr:hypothetical protein FRC08_015332 [Ceratobasidium sp. 394]KAG9101799.1 hypothetical protein FS749_003102 [Ceratobasidium sp. UAMH 11750]
MRFKTEVGLECRHEERKCKHLRILVVFINELRADAQAFVKHLGGQFMGEGWNFEYAMVEWLPDANSAFIRTEDEDTLSSFCESQGCSVIAALYIPPRTRGSALLCAKEPELAWDLPKFLKSKMPINIQKCIENSCSLDVVLPFNAMECFDPANSPMTEIHKAIKASQINSVVMLFRFDRSIWRHTWCTAMLATALVTLIGLRRQPAQAYLHAWIGSPIGFGQFDLAVLTRTSGVSYLSAPLLTRPLGRALPPISAHRKAEGRVCMAPFMEGQPVTPRYAEPMYVFAKRELEPAPYDQPKSLGKWRSDQERNMQLPWKLGPSVKKVFACCSWCGFGENITLQAAESLGVFMGCPYVSVQWP